MFCDRFGTMDAMAFSVTAAERTSRTSPGDLPPNPTTSAVPIINNKNSFETMKGGMSSCWCLAL